MIPLARPSRYFIELYYPDIDEVLIAWSIEKPHTQAFCRGRVGFKLVLYKFQGNIFATVISVN